jgi:serine/threonine-protein kinase
MGIVYSAIEQPSGRRVALKVLPRAMTVDELFVQRFLREATLAGRIDHPNVVPIYDTAKEDETYVIAMELVEGMNLAELCDGRPIQGRRALRIARQVASGLSALKQAGVLHRDIKPENVIVTARDKVKITDFGIARDLVATTRMTETGVGVGSVIYASPEQIQGRGDFRSDIYSLGCTLYFMLNGVDPFPPDKSIDRVLKHKLARPPRVREFQTRVPQSLRELVMTMIDARPAHRFQNYDELLAAIDELIEGRGAAGAPDRRRRAWLAFGMAAACAAIVLLLWRLWGYG